MTYYCDLNTTYNFSYSKGKKEKRPSDGANIQNFTTKSSTATSKKNNGFLTYEEVIYWQEHFKLPEHEAGLSPQLSVTNKSRRSLSEAKKPVTQPSLSEWLPWQTTLHPVKAATHSRRTEHLVELLEFTELQGGRGDDDESYDLEMMSFLNEEDILKPGQREEDAKENLVFETDPDVACEESECTRKITKKTKRTRKKLPMEEETDAENDGQSSRKEENGEDGAIAKNKSKGLKKPSPKNKARWKAFLNQFDNKEDEDFESDGVNAAAVSDEDNAADDCLQRADDEKLEYDLPDMGDPWEPVDKPEGDCNNHLRLNDNNKPEATHKEVTRIQECKGDDLSDATSDEMTNLFPAVTLHSQSSVPGFQLQNDRFPLMMDSVPTPPSLDALDKMSLSSTDVELDEFNMDFEEIQRRYFGNLFEKDIQEKSGVLSPSVSQKVCFESELLTEPFPKADFLQEEETYTGAEASEDEIFKMSRNEKKSRVFSTSDCSSETASRTHIDKPIRGESRFLDDENQNSKDNECNFGSNLREERGSQVVSNKCNTLGSMKNCDTHGISNDTVADVDYGSPIKEQDATFQEAFFMDVTDEDDAFMNKTLPGDDNIGVNDTQREESKSTGEQDLLPEREWMRNKSANLRHNEVNMSQTRLDESKHVDKSDVTAAEQCGTSVDVDGRKSFSKMSAAVQRCLTNNHDPHPEKDKFGVLKKREVTLPMEARSTLPFHEVRTRGEHSNLNAVHNDADVGMLDASRNSGAAPPNMSVKELSSKFGMKLSNPMGAFWDGLPCRDSKGERPERKSQLTGLISRGRVANGNGNAGDNIRNNVSGNTSIKISDKEDDVGDHSNDNACRTPLPKKRKLSLKRTSPKDKGIPVTNRQGKHLPVNEASLLDFGASRSVNSKAREDKFCSTNVKEPEAHSSLWVTECKVSETSVKQSPAIGTDLKGSLMNCENPSANSTNLRTENGNVVAVMESDDEDEEDIRPVGKASSRMRQALSSPCSQGFKKPYNPGNHDDNPRHGLSSRHLQLGSESDEEFETHKSGEFSLRCLTSFCKQPYPFAFPVRLPCERRLRLEPKNSILMT